MMAAARRVIFQASSRKTTRALCTFYREGQQSNDGGKYLQAAKLLRLPTHHELTAPALLSAISKSCSAKSDCEQAFSLFNLVQENCTDSSLSKSQLLLKSGLSRFVSDSLHESKLELAISGHRYLSSIGGRLDVLTFKKCVHLLSMEGRIDDLLEVVADYEVTEEVLILVAEPLLMSGRAEDYCNLLKRFVAEAMNRGKEKEEDEDGGQSIDRSFLRHADRRFSKVVRSIMAARVRSAFGKTHISERNYELFKEINATIYNYYDFLQEKFEEADLSMSLSGLHWAKQMQTWDDALATKMDSSIKPVRRGLRRLRLSRNAQRTRLPVISRIDNWNPIEVLQEMPTFEDNSIPFVAGDVYFDSKSSFSGARWRDWTAQVSRLKPRSNLLFSNQTHHEDFEREMNLLHNSWQAQSGAENFYYGGMIHEGGKSHPDNIEFDIVSFRGDATPGRQLPQVMSLASLQMDVNDDDEDEEEDNDDPDSDESVNGDISLFDGNEDFNISDEGDTADESDDDVDEMEFTVEKGSSHSSFSRDSQLAVTVTISDRGRAGVDIAYVVVEDAQDPPLDEIPSAQNAAKSTFTSIYGDDNRMLLSPAGTRLFPRSNDLFGKSPFLSPNEIVLFSNEGLTEDDLPR